MKSIKSINDRYETVLEFVPIYNNKFVCSYLPVYGLVGVGKMILQAERHTSFINIVGNTLLIKYITEKIYCDDLFHGDELIRVDALKIIKAD